MYNIGLIYRHIYETYKNLIHKIYRTVVDLK